jgi:hypothetical protein
MLITALVSTIFRIFWEDGTGMEIYRESLMLTPHDVADWL